MKQETPAKVTLKQSYAFCRKVTCRSGSNFHFAFYMLPHRKRQAMYALYAFLRKTDDLSDSRATVEEKQNNISQWRESLQLAIKGDYRDPILPALIDTVRAFELPMQYLVDVIDGVEMDLQQSGFATFDELEVYCYRVASAVGLACIHIWGFDDPGALEPARQCGIAFQLTNILRDLQEDAARGRIYLPQQDLLECGYGEQDLFAGRTGNAFRLLIARELTRAEEHYRAACELARYLTPEGRRVFGVMFSTYYLLLQKVRASQDDLFTRRIRVGRLDKLKIAARWLLTKPSLSVNKPLACKSDDTDSRVSV